VTERQRMEMRVLALLELVNQAGQGNEDSFVEYKRDLPADPKKAARQIAGICNAARGGEALWVVGVDEKAGQIVGAPGSETQAWWPSVEKWFDELAPEMRQIVVPVDDKIVVGLFFSTDRAPYVVRTDGHEGGVQREVPWRAGLSTRSAKRHELMKILMPSVALPPMEIIFVRCSASRHPAVPPNPDRGTLGHGPAVYVQVNCGVFADAQTAITFPTHRQRGQLRVGDRTFDLTLETRPIGAIERSDPTVFASELGVRVQHPGLIAFSARLSFDQDVSETTKLLWSSGRLSLDLKLCISGCERTAALTCDATQASRGLLPDDPHSYANIGTWRFGDL
jgi:hypothetical protein